MFNKLKKRNEKDDGRGAFRAGQSAMVTDDMWTYFKGKIGKIISRFNRESNYYQLLFEDGFKGYFHKDELTAQYDSRGDLRR